MLTVYSPHSLSPPSLYSHWRRHRSAQQCEQRVPGPRRGSIFWRQALFKNTQSIKNTVCYLYLLVGLHVRIFDKSGYTCIFLAFADALLADAIHKWKRIVSSLTALSRFISEYGWIHVELQQDGLSRYGTWQSSRKIHFCCGGYTYSCPLS